MDEQKKQKVMIGVLVALVLGAGAYFVAFRDSGGSAKASAEVKHRGRRVSKSTTEAKNTGRRQRATKKANTDRQVTERKAVRDRGAPTASKRKRGRRGKLNVKKKKLEPMG